MNLEIDCDERPTRLQVRLCRSCKAWETFFFLRFSCLRYLCVWHHTDQRSIVISLRKSQRSGTATVEIIEITEIRRWFHLDNAMTTHISAVFSTLDLLLRWFLSGSKMAQVHIQVIQVIQEPTDFKPAAYMAYYIYILLYITIVQSSRKDSQGKRRVAWQVRSPAIVTIPCFG